MSSDCVIYMSGHIDTKYLDQAFWIYDRIAASRRLKLSRPQQWNRPICKFGTQIGKSSITYPSILLQVTYNFINFDLKRPKLKIKLIPVQTY